jgi:hypothetical protein
VNRCPPAIERDGQRNATHLREAANLEIGAPRKLGAPKLSLHLSFSEPRVLHWQVDMPGKEIRRLRLWTFPGKVSGPEGIEKGCEADAGLGQLPFDGGGGGVLVVGF